MKARLVLFCIWAITAGITANGPMPKPTEDRVMGQWIVRLVPSASLQSQPVVQARLSRWDRLAQIPEWHAQPLFPNQPKRRTSLAADSPLDRYVLITANPDGPDLGPVLAAHPDVELVEPNYTAFLTATPTDYQATRHWNLAAANAPAAWEITRGDASQLIAVIDTGIHLDHPDLADRIWTNPAELEGDANSDGCPGDCGVDDDGDGLIDEDGAGRQLGEPGYDPSYAADDDENGYRDDFHGWNWAGINTESNDPTDDLGHGTHVAGIIAASADNGSPALGICPECRILPLKAFDRNGIGSFADIARAVDYARRAGATVINMSFSSRSESTLLRDALQAAAPNAVLVASAGNDGETRDEAPYYPAAWDFVLGVESTDQQGQRSSFSNSGYDISAPGESIFSAFMSDNFTTWSGTSMAAPLVAGQAGLVRDQHPQFSASLTQGQLTAADGDTYQALVLEPQPDLQIIDIKVVDTEGSCDVCDGDGMPDAGETVDLVVTLRNRWGAAETVSAQLQTLGQDVTLLKTTADYGPIGSLESRQNTADPFRIQISPQVDHGDVRQFSLRILADGDPKVQSFPLSFENRLSISGVIDQDRTWYSGHAYYLDGDVLLTQGTTLTIEPGVNIYWDRDVTFISRGATKALGEADNRINFIGLNQAVLEIREPVSAMDQENGVYLSGTYFKHCTFKGAVNAVSLSNYTVFYMEDCIIDIPGQYFSRYNGKRNLWIDYDYVYYLFGVLRDNTFTAPDGVRLFHESAGSPLNFGDNNFTSENTALDQIRAENESLPNQYWGATHPDVIDDLIFDQHDHVSRGLINYEPYLQEPNPNAPVLVQNIHLDPPNQDLFPYHRRGSVELPATLVGEDLVTFTVTFSRDMNTDHTPLISFGTQPPYDTHRVTQDGQWLDARTWQAKKEISIYTGDGVQTLVVQGAEDTAGFPLSRNDRRFSFLIDTSNSGGRALGSTSGNGSICLTWQGDDERAIGYNVYRAESKDGPYDKINSAIIAEPRYEDYSVYPETEYCYIFRPMTTGLLEGPNSVVSCNRARDHIPPEIQHQPVTQATPDRPITLNAQITDNAAVQEAVLYVRASESADYTSLPMLNATGNLFTATIPAQSVQPPSLDYYISAYDGRHQTLSGSAQAPYIISVIGEPVIDTVSSVEGPASGGETVTLTGSNFKPGVTVFFGEEEAPVIYYSENRLVVTTPAHYPWHATISAVNTGGFSSQTSQTYTFLGQPATLSPPRCYHEPNQSIQIPLTTEVEGFRSAQFTFNFDPDVLAYVDATPGSLNANAQVTATQSQAGELQCTVFGEQPVSGEGSILFLNFNIIGGLRSHTYLTMSDGSFNQSLIPLTLDYGFVDVDYTFSLAGSVRFFLTDEPLPQFAVRTAEDAGTLSLTDVDGNWAFPVVPQRGVRQIYTFQDTDDDGGTVTALDAARILSHINGEFPLDEIRISAANVTGNALDASDAATVLERAVGIIAHPLPRQEHVASWGTYPTQYIFNPLDSDHDDLDFKAFIVGDVTGNWAVQPTPAPGDPVTLELSEHRVGPDSPLTIDLTAADITTPFNALDLILTYDPNVLQITNVSTPLNGMSAYHEPQSGLLDIALAVGSPITTDGVVLQLQFESMGALGQTTQLHFQEAVVDEGAQNAALIDGQIEFINVIYFPDHHFRNFVLNHYDTDQDGDITPTEAAAVNGFMYCNGLDIQSLEGIGHFVNLRGLYCENNNLTQLPDLSALTQLQQLRCYNNQLTQLPDLSALTQLTQLYCFNNRLTSLPDLSGLVRLERLYVMVNKLTSLPDMSGLTALKDFQCHYNQLTALPDLSGLDHLQIIQAEYNQFSQFPDLTGLSALRTLSLHHNNFDQDDCPAIQLVQNMGLTSFSYNPQRDNTEVSCAPCQSPTIFTQPFNVTACLGEPVTFSVGVEATPPVTFQWRRNGEDIPNANQALLTLPEAEVGGSYTCTITNTCGSITSQTAVLTVQTCLEGIEIIPPTLTVTESGGVDVAWIALSAAPTAPVTLTFSTQSDEAEVLTPQITFRPTDWSQPRSVLVRGRDDDQTDGPVSTTLITHPVVSTDIRYSGLDPVDPIINNLDDDTPGTVLFEAPRHARAERGQSVRIPLRLGQSDGVRGMQWRFNFDPNMLTYNGFDTTGLLLNDWTVTDHLAAPGILDFGAFNSRPLEGSGILIYLSFTVGYVPLLSQSHLTLSQVMLNAGFPAAEAVSGKLRVVNCNKGDMDSDGFFTQQDAALAMSHVVDQLIWDYPAVGESCVDTNCNGVVEAVDARLISHRALGLIDDFCAEPLSGATGEVAVLAMDDLDLDPDTDFQTHLRLLDVTPEMILEGFQMTLTYNPDVIQIQDINLAEVGAGMSLLVNDRIPGRMKLAAYSLNGIEARSGLLLSIHGRAVARGVTHLLPEDVGLNAGGPSLTVIPGRIQVGEQTIPTIVAAWPGVSILDLVQNVNQNSAVR